MCGKKLQRATDIISGLGGEKDRWASTAQSLSEIYDTLTGEDIYLLLNHFFNILYYVFVVKGMY